MNKICTSIEQSQKLIELGIDVNTADMYWLNRYIDLIETKYELLVVDRSNKHIDFFNSYAIAVEEGEIIPCWSLSALFDIMPHIQEFYPIIEKINDKFVCRYKGSGIWINGTDSVDVCVEMINLLKEKELI